MRSEHARVGDAWAGARESASRRREFINSERTNPGLAQALRGWATVVEVKNDAQLAAIAEGSEGAAIGCRDYVALLAGERFGGGVVVDGHVLHGAHGGVGEGVVFDHIIGVGSAFGLRYAVQDAVRDAVAAREIAADGAVGTLAAPDRIDPRLVLTLASAGDVDARLVSEPVAPAGARDPGVVAGRPGRLARRRDHGATGRQGACGAAHGGAAPDAARREKAAVSRRSNSAH